MTPEQLSSVLHPQLKACTAGTITSRQKLWEELDAIRAAGVAYDREEHTEGITAIGAVVRDAYGLAGAISVPMPTQRFKQHEKILAPRLIAICDRRRRASVLEPALRRFVRDRSRVAPRQAARRLAGIQLIC